MRYRPWQDAPNFDVVHIRNRGAPERRPLLDLTREGGVILASSPPDIDDNGGGQTMGMNGTHAPTSTGPGSIDLRTFRPARRQEGMSRNPNAPDTAIALALKEARDKKDAERKAQQDADRKKKLDRLEMLRAKSAEPKTKKAPQRPAWEGDVEIPTPQLQAIAKAIGAPGTPERREHMRRAGVASQEKMFGTFTPEERSERMRRIARGESPNAPPPPPERYQEPRVVPPAPDDPRVTNGTLAPSERVAELIAKAAAIPASTEPVKERPLQDSPYPPGYAEMLETGTPSAILGGRAFSQLNDHEQAAYQRALGREGHALQIARGENPSLRPRRPRVPLDKMTVLGRTITSLRLDRGWTNHDLENAAGLKAATVRKTLTAEAVDVPPSRLQALANAFGIDVEALTGQTTRSPSRRKRSEMTPEERLQFLMDRASLNSSALAKLGGISRTTIDNALHGIRPLSLKSAKALAPILKTYPAKIMPTVTEPEPQLEDQVAEAAAPPPVAEPEPEAAPEPASAPERRVRPPASPLVRNIRRLARAKDMTDRDVSKKAGLWENAVRDMNRRTRAPKPETLQKLADALGTTPDALLVEYGEQPPVAVVPATMAGALIIAEPPRGEVVEAEAMTFVPRVAIEKGIPLPASFALSQQMYRFDELEKGDSIRADVPFGMDWEVFARRFAMMVHKAQNMTGHWYHTEAADDRSHIRLWRVV